MTDEATIQAIRERWRVSIPTDLAEANKVRASAPQYLVDLLYLLQAYDEMKAENERLKATAERLYVEETASLKARIASLKAQLQGKERREAELEESLERSHEMERWLADGRTMEDL